jgi:beta-glucosidase
MNLRLILFFSFSLSISVFAQTQKKDSSRKLSLSVKHAVASMTLEEKLKLVTGTGMPGKEDAPVIGNAGGKVAGCAGNTMSFPRLNIPATVYADGPAGVRIDTYRGNDRTKSYFTTAWPVGTLLASSWDTTLVKKVGIAFGNEVKEYGIDFILAPGMNIQRDPLNGRNFEYYSEDPLVTGFVGAAMIKGIQANGVGVAMKHFAANNQETKRNSVNVIASERALREIYLKGFEIAVKKASPLTVMSSYNRLNGTYTSERYDLLTTILRDEWHFKGFVMTDWFGGKDPVAQMKAGNDLIMPGSDSKREKLLAAIENKNLDIQVVNKNAERILNVLKQTPSFSNYKYSNNPDLVAHAAVARYAASQGMVLLKNNNTVLPLKKETKVILYGNASYETIIGGLGSGDVYEKYSISIIDGLKNAGFRTSESLRQKYLTHIEQDKVAHPMPKVTMGTIRMTPEMDLTPDVIKQTVNEADLAVYTIGRNSSEGGDRKIENDFNLTESERLYLKNISDTFHAAGKKLVVIINVCGPIEIASWRDYADAILLVWQPGQEAGNAIADVISGAVTPSGKLTVTFPMTYTDEPTAKNFPGLPASSPTDVTYEEGIYVGYRYFNSFNVKPAYEFGYGLSYTTFSYSGLKLCSSTFKDKITATVTITNTGKIAGKEVVQLYLSAPEKMLDKPSAELKAFAKTNLLKPGASQTITFQLNARDLASYNTDLSAWIADGGTYTVRVGASSLDIKSTKQFNLAKDMMVEKAHKALASDVVINELKKK